jgi:hypothetical protein
MCIRSIWHSKGGETHTEVICSFTTKLEAGHLEVEAARHNWAGEVETMGALAVGKESIPHDCHAMLLRCSGHDMPEGGEISFRQYVGGQEEGG